MGAFFEMQIAKTDFRSWVTSNHITSFDDVLSLADRFAPITREQASADKAKLGSGGTTISNYVTVPLDGGQTYTEPLNFRETFDRAMMITDNWPRRVGEDRLFVDTGTTGERIRHIRNEKALFGYFWERAKVDWDGKRDKLGKGEFFEQLKTSATKYGAIEEFPHFPNPIPGVYYATDSYEPGDGKMLARFLDFFSPATADDYFLLEAMILTIFWGGPSGARPCFLLTTTKDAGKGGVGTGKSITAQYIANLAGGYNEFDRGEKIDQIKRRLLSGSHLTRRVLLLDNIKSDRFQWGGFEAMITGKDISGHAMYSGNDATPNYYTWFLTLNTPSLGTDIAKRCIPVELQKPKYTKDWQIRMDAFLTDNHAGVISDVMARFNESPQSFENRCRWGVWAYEILGRLPDPQVIHDTLIERQEEFDSEADEGFEYLRMIRDELVSLKYLHDDTVFLPTSLLAVWMTKYFDEKVNTRQAGIRIGKAVTEGHLPGMRQLKGRIDQQRGFIWGPGTDAEAKKDANDRAKGRTLGGW